ncbi:MAG TPA: aminotransferase class III-fold pyridoxal phosphate-dependent enzyme [Solirubrobacterales bacterium]|nr:aminotransferase class III-fold pyridoxal phosphate-dependent enzyme [Solirubrobacterales bacterium]
MTAAAETRATLREAARRSVYHFGTDYGFLDENSSNRFPRFIERGEGAYLIEEGGRKLLDGGHTLGACAVGHGREEVAKRIYEQAQRLSYSSLEGGISHEPVALLAEELAGMLPVRDPVLFFTSTGSEANEAALKVARAIQASRGKPRKTKILARAGGYHGSSYGALTISGNPALREGFSPGLGGVVRTSQPSPGRCGYCTPEEGCHLGCAEDVRRTIEQEGPDTVAAFVAEPVSVHQAIKVPAAEYWKRIQAVCQEYDVLLVADEVVTGFGRTGKMFGSEHWGIDPDVVVMAKGITSGYVPLGGIAVAREHAERLPSVGFIHINTYAGHPVACAAALANLEILGRERLPERAARMEGVLREELEQLKQIHPGIWRTSAIGLLGSVEFAVPDAATGGLIAKRLRQYGYESGALFRAGAERGIGTVWFLPPLIVDEDQTRAGVRIIGSALGSIYPAAVADAGQRA